jgi:hypothetical protein
LAFSVPVFSVPVFSVPVFSVPVFSEVLGFFGVRCREHLRLRAV